MLKRFLLSVILCLPSFFLSAQKAKIDEFSAIDKIALKMPDSLAKNTAQIAKYINAHFGTDKDKIRAIFIWVASTIKYDIDNMFAINFYEKEEEKIAKPLRTKKGICENYAALFTDICKKSGIKSFVVTGYTKQNGFTDYIPHAWSAALIDNSWFLFDPTWGSGYVNGGKFFKKINNSYFKVNPTTMIKSHIPFDYLWQFLNYPITNQEFFEGKTQQNKSKEIFNFIEELAFYEKQSAMDKLNASAIRVEKNGLKNSIVFEHLRYLKLEIETQKQKQTYDSYNLAVHDYNTMVNNLNHFINYRNNQFKPMKTDAEIQVMLDVVEKKAKETKSNLNQIVFFDDTSSKMIQQLTKAIDDVQNQVNEQNSWLKEYFSKGKLGRKSMFYKVTWFGIPID
jgi:transglutaminase/protease-like cytokinesis protein 3